MSKESKQHEMLVRSLAPSVAAVIGGGIIAGDSLLSQRRGERAPTPRESTARGDGL